MKLLINQRSLLIAVLIFAGSVVMAQTASTKNVSTMKTYLIERDIPNAGKFTAAELKGISQKSCGVITEMGPGIKWLQSYVTGNKIYCVYMAENEELIREHGRKGGFPVTSITEISSTISPETAK